MLGGEQSGHIEAVGFELYTSMLEAAVKEMKGETSEERPATQLNLGIALRIDESYVPEENQRLRLYKKIAGSTSEAAWAISAQKWKTAMARHLTPLCICWRRRGCGWSANGWELRRSTGGEESCRFGSWKTPPSIRRI